MRVRVRGCLALAAGVASAVLSPGGVADQARPENVEASFRLPALGAPASSEALLLAIDERAFPFQDKVTLSLNKPVVRAEPVLIPSTSPDAPDNAAVHFYGSVVNHDGRFQMWYNAVHFIDREKNLMGESPVCYAESSDGVHWTRPNLGQVEFRGSRNNNIVALGDNPLGSSAGLSVILDDEDPNPARRYKIAWGYIDPGPVKQWLVGTAVSPDGIHWTKLPNDAYGGRTVEFASLYKHGGLYIVTGHILGRGEGDRPEGRQGYAIVSTDFNNWVSGAAPSFKTAEPLRGSGYGREDGTGLYTQVHLGVGGTSFGNVVVGLWGMWHHRQPRWGEMGIDCDLGLVVSHDGIHYDEVVKGRPYIRSDEAPANPVPGRTYPTILGQSNTALNVDKETWIYHGRWRNAEFIPQPVVKPNEFASKHYWAGVGLAKLPRDRWGSFGLWGDEKTGSVWTTPITLPAGGQLRLNASGLDGMRVEITDERFQPIAGFEQGLPGAGEKDSLDAVVAWPGRSLGELAGKTIRIRIHFVRGEGDEPRLFAMNLTRK